ncbi:hypothetical protein FEZ32_13395 [Acidipropionibacterium jensenii]|nr:hypothetical protein FEZ32_13395 [Acidipropionibacterium jensenii]
MQDSAGLEGSTPENAVVVTTIVPSRSGHAVPVARVMPGAGTDETSGPSARLRRPGCTFIPMSGFSPSSSWWGCCWPTR